MKRVSAAFVVSVFLALPALAMEAPSADTDWAWWRGPNHNGVAAEGQTPPVNWTDTENVIWRAPVPGRGHSSPTVVGDRIFLATADEANQVQGVIAFDRNTGKQQWIREVSRGGFPKTHPKNTHATCTVACDGERLFVAFHHHRKVTLAALDLDGKILWQKDVGPFDPKIYEYGYAPSPVLYGSTVIVAADSEKGGHLTAFDCANGRKLWQQPRPKKLSFSSPIIANIAGRDQLFISGCDLVNSYDPKNGKELWSANGTAMATCGTMVWDGDLVFASGGYPKAETICVKADGSGKVMWRNQQKCYEQSMLAHNGYVYAITDRGVLFCWQARDGKMMWQQRFRGPVSTSPILAGGNIYASNEAGTTIVFKANPQQFEMVAQNQLGTESFATPAFCGNRIYARVATGRGAQRQEYLYCLGSK